MMWVAAIALLALGLGLRSGWRVLKGLRQPAPVDEALLWWDEEPVSASRDTPFVASLLAVHGSAIAVMGVLALLAGGRALAAPPGWLLGSEEIWSASGSIRIVYYAAVALSVGLAWYIIGAMLHPLAGRRLRPIRMALAEDGIRHGALFFPWSSFGAMRQECPRGLIHLMSRRSPWLVLLTVCPPGDELLDRVQQTIEAHLQPLPENYRLPWYRRRAVFGLCLLLPALLPALVGLWVYPSTAVWVWASQGFGAWLAAWLGAVLIRAYR